MMIIIIPPRTLPLNNPHGTHALLTSNPRPFLPMNQSSRMEARVLEPLNNLETQINSLIQTLTTTNTWTSAPLQTQSLLATDDDLSTALTLLQRHQQNYARILHLREESLALEQGLKTTIRQCVSLREEVGRIHPSILDDSSDDDDDDEEDGDQDQHHNNPPASSSVDYHTLLAFAARVGKHNAAAAREAESEATRLKMASKSSTAPTASNGIQDTQTRTEETDAELQRINNNIAFRHAQMGMAFPDASGLRVGELGKLQLFRERQALLLSAVDVQRQQEELDRAVDKEVENWVRASENIAEADVDADDLAVHDPAARPGEPSGDLSGTRRRASHGQGLGRVSLQDSTAATQSRSQQGQAPPPPRRKLDLDFPSSDDEDDD